MATALRVTHELINDLPLLWHVLHDQLQYDEILDGLQTRHGNWDGLSQGQVLVTWLMHILSGHNHFMNQVQDWAGPGATVVGGLVGAPPAPDRFDR
jgi:hypothetical protein